MRICVVLAFLLASIANAATVSKNPGEKIVYVDGVYDLAHFGHRASFEKAKQYAAKFFHIPESKVKVLVGVTGGNLKAYKREPVMSLDERAKQVQSMKGVDAVYKDSPFVTTEAFMNKEGIDLVMHGDDFSTEKAKLYYEAAMKKGRYQSFPRIKGMSSSKLIRRATTLTLEGLLEKSKSQADINALKRVIALVKSAKKI